MEEKGNTSSEKDFAFTKRQISFMYEYYYENGTFEDAIDNHKKFGVDIERAKQNLIKKYEKGSAAHSNASWGWESTEIDFEAICKKNN